LSFQSIVHQEVAWFDDPKNSRLTTITVFNVLFSLFLLKGF